MVGFFVFVIMILLSVRARKRQPLGKLLIVFKTSATASFLKYTVGTVFVLYIIGLIYQFFNSSKNVSENIFQALFWMAWAFFMLTTQGRKSTATENGISYMGNFYPWQSISSWKWSKNMDSILINAKLRKKTYVPLAFNLKVTKTDFDKVNDIFTKYAGKPKNN